MSDPSDRPLAGQLALVTGGALRLGRAAALALAGQGVDVVVHHHRSEDPARALVTELEALGVKAWAVRADLADADAAAGLADLAARAAGRPVDVLLNSAGIFGPSRVLEFPLDELDRNLQVNALAPLLLARSLARHDRPAQIVNFLDARVVEYDRLHAAYHLSKRMLLTITRMLALELAPAIRVNAVAPGLILPPEGKDEAYLQRLAERVPLKRHGSAKDVVRAVLFLLCSDYVTGQVIYLDGGGNLMSNTYGG